MKEGLIVKSLKGHDTGRIYLVVASLDENFVLLCDGQYRKIDNPKQKRVKHLEVVGTAPLVAELTNSSIRKFCKL